MATYTGLSRREMTNRRPDRHSPGRFDCASEMVYVSFFTKLYIIENHRRVNRSIEAEADSSQDGDTGMRSGYLRTSLEYPFRQFWMAKKWFARHHGTDAL